MVFDFVCGIPFRSMSVDYLEQFITPPLIIFTCEHLSGMQDPDKVPKVKLKGVFLFFILFSFFILSEFSFRIVTCAGAILIEQCTLELEAQVMSCREST